MAGRNSIYEVFRACRLCGGGGGYKMPIVNLEDELDMRHKIRECVRIEVHRDDKMPPLICELCVDKVNDYFEFLEMCRATDTRTRDRLGLPQIAFAQPGNDGGDCILGVTEPVYINDDSNDEAEPLARQKNRLVLGAKGKKPATPTPPTKKRKSSPIPVISITRTGLKDVKTGVKELRVSVNGSRDSSSGSRQSRSSSTTRSSRSGRRAPSPPPPASRRETRRDDSKEPLKKLKNEPDRKRHPQPPPPPAAAKRREDSKQRGVLKPQDERSLLREKAGPAGKREREREDPGQAKRVKIAIKSTPPARAVRPGPVAPPRAEKRRAASPPRPPPPPKRKAPEPYACQLCRQAFGKQGSLTNHLRAAHSPTFTPDKLACNACGEWFRSAEETGTHHRWHKSAAPYVCRLCTAEFKQYNSFAKHFANKQCVPSTEVDDVQCAECWLYFATAPLLLQHRCRGEDGRPGGNCAKCKRKYATYKTLRRHEESCFKPGPKSKGGAVTVSPEIQRRLHPMQVRVARCDTLLTSVKQEKHYDVSHIERFFGLDKTCVYPYISSVRSIKTEPHDYDLSRVKSELTDDFVCEDNFNYESFTDSDSEPELVETEPHLVVNPFARKKKKKVDALSTLSIKAIFSSRCLGQKKIQRKRLRRMKQEKMEIKTELELEHPIDKEAKSEMIESCNGVENEAEGEGRNAFEDTFDDDVERDVRSTVDDLIAGLNNADDVAPETEDGASKDISASNESQMSKVTNDQEAIEANVEVEPSNAIADEAAKTVDMDESSDVKEVIESTQKSDETSTETEDVKTVEESQDKETIETIDKVDADKDQIAEKADIERPKDESESKMDVDDDEFDVNSIFSGALGSTALKSKGELTHPDEKTEETTEGKAAQKDAETGAQVSEKRSEREMEVGEKRTEDTEIVEKTEIETASAEKSVSEVENNEKIPSIDVRLAEHDEKDTALDEKTDEQFENISNDSMNKLSEKEDLQQTDSTEKLTQGDDSKERISQRDDLQLDSTEQLTQKDDSQIDSTEQLTQKDDSQIDSTEQLTQKDDSQIDSTEPLSEKDDKSSSQNELPRTDGSQEDSLQNTTHEDGNETESTQQSTQKDDLMDDSDKFEELIASSDNKDRSVSDTELDNISDSELMDDNELMEELDAQIKENTKEVSASERDGAKAEGGEKSLEPEKLLEPEEKSLEPEEKSVELEEKISLDELLMASAEVTKTTDAKLRESMDLDTISDEEFNFDA